MKPTGQHANTASTSKTGMLALLWNPLGFGGTGAPKSPLRLFLSILLPALAVLALTAVPALAAAPKVLSESAPFANASEARLEGVVNPESEVTECHFQYGKTLVSENEVQCEQSVIEGGEQGVGVTVLGLSKTTTYAYRVVLKNIATNEEGFGATEHFTTATPPEKPETSNPAKSVSATSAVLEGTLNPKASGEVETGSYFLYSTEARCSEATGQTEPVAAAKIKPKTKTGPVEVVGLEPNETYVFCLLATNSVGEATLGNEVTVKTEPAPPAVEAEGVSGVNTNSGNLEAVVNAKNEKTEYRFEYSTKASGDPLVLEAPIVTLPVPSGELGAVFGGQGVAVPTGEVLIPDTTYYYRAVAENEQSTKEHKSAEGPVQRFETFLEAPAQQPAEPAGYTAKLKGVVNPANAGEPVTYEFLYKQSESECELSQLEREKNQKAEENEKPAIYIQKTTPVAQGSGATEAVSAEIGGLSPSTHYAFCLRVHNGVSEATGAVEAFETTTTFPAIGEEAAAGVTASEAILDAKIDPGNLETHYRIEYGAGTAYGSSSTEATLPAAIAPVPAGRTVTGLEPGTLYHYRFVATNTDGTIHGADATFTTPGAQATGPDACANAKLRSEQPYGSTLPDCRAYEMVSPLEKNGFGVESIDSRASVANGGAGEPQPAVVYLSRGSFGGSQGANKVNRYLSTRTPSGWSTRNITPPQVPDEAPRNPFAELLFTPTLSGGVVKSEAVPLVTGQSTGEINLYTADFASDPATYAAVTNIPAGAKDQIAEAQTTGASSDLSHVVFDEAANLTPNAKGLSAGGEPEHIYDWVAGKLQLVDVPPAGASFEAGENAEDETGAPAQNARPEYGDTWHAVSDDGSRVFFTSKTSGGRGGQLYVRENPEQEAESAVNANGECTEPAKACTVEVSKSQREPEDPNTHAGTAWFRGASADGEHVFFTSRVELTEDARTGPDDNAANLYEYDLETNELTDLTAATEAQEHNREDPDGAAVLGLVTASEDVGEEGSYIYFVANGVLAAGATPGNCLVENAEPYIGERTCNLYVEHRGTGGWQAPRFIATLAGSSTNYNGFGASIRLGLAGGAFDSADEVDWQGNEGIESGDYENDQGPNEHHVRVSADGATLAFESERDLTGYDTQPREPGAGSSESQSYCTTQDAVITRENETATGCRQVYVYKAGSGGGSGSLICASCDPSGARPVGPAELGGQEDEIGGGFTIPSSSYLTHNLSENGERLFFQSPDPLVPSDSNGKRDVYEWEADGEGSCTEASSTYARSSDGCVFPISDVAGDHESKFMDATPNGESVFIATQDRLVYSDTDSRTDVYDVRVGGGFPFMTPPPVCDNGDSCKPPQAAQPSIYGAPSSATFSGPGNLAPEPAATPTVPPGKRVVKCAKGKVRKGMKCVKHRSRRKKPKQASKSHEGARS